jgi:hypothetical protein
MIIKNIDENNKLTSGTLVNAENDIIKFLSKKAKNNSKYFTLNENAYTDLKLKESYSANVKCHADDVYDIEEGKKLVKFKTLDKYYKSFDGKLKKAIVDLLCFGFDLLNYVYNHIGQDLGDSIVIDVANKTGYIITYEDEFDIDGED